MIVDDEVEKNWKEAISQHLPGSTEWNLGSRLKFEISQLWDKSVITGNLRYVRFQVLTTASMKMTVFWYVARRVVW
jgi:hypothetical protein